MAIQRRLSDAAQRATGITPTKDPKPGRRLFNDPVLIRQRVISDAARKNETQRKPPDSDTCETICNDGICQTVCKPATLSPGDVQTVSFEDLYSLLQTSAKYAGITIPNHHLSMIQSFDTWMALNYSDEEREAMPGLGLDNLRIITNRLRDVMAV